MSQPNKTRVQVATDPAFSNVVYDVNGNYTTSLQVAEDVLPTGINLYARGMHGHPGTGDSSWSTTVQFRIKLAWSDWDGSANGLEYVITELNRTAHPSLVKLSDDRVLVTYGNYDNNGIYSRILTITGTTLTVGTPVAILIGGSSSIKSTLLSPNKVLLCYHAQDQNYNIYARILTIDGDSISLSTAVRCNYTNSVYLSLVAISETKALVCYRNTDHNHYLYSTILTISGTDIIASTSVQCSSIRSDYISAVVVSENKVLVCYSYFEDTQKLYSTLITVTGTDITFTAPVRCNFTYSTFIESVTISENKVVVMYRNSSDNNYLYAILLIVENNSIVVGVPVKCNSTHSKFMSMVKLAYNSVLVCYRNDGDTNLYGTVLSVDETTIATLVHIKCNNSPTGGWGEYDIDTVKLGNKVLVVYNKGTLTSIFAKVLMND